MANAPQSLPGVTRPAFGRSPELEFQLVPPTAGVSLQRSLTANHTQMSP